MTYTPSDTSILLVDPYNDFLSEGGKAWPRVKDVATKVDLLDHLREVVCTARANGYRLFFEAQRQAARVISAHSAEETPLFAIHIEKKARAGRWR